MASVEDVFSTFQVVLTILMAIIKGCIINLFSKVRMLAE